VPAHRDCTQGLVVPLNRDTSRGIEGRVRIIALLMEDALPPKVHDAAKADERLVHFRT
jgi:hypothetical protein